MDEQRFDAVTKAFGASKTRRRMLLGVVGALTGTLGQLEAEAKRKRHPAKNKHRNDAKRNKPGALAKEDQGAARRCATFGQRCRGRRWCCDTLWCDEETSTCGCVEDLGYVRCGDQCVDDCRFATSPHIAFNPDTCACECRLDPASCPPGTTADLDPNHCECCVPLGDRLEGCGADGGTRCCFAYPPSGGCCPEGHCLHTDPQGEQIFRCCAPRGFVCQRDIDCCDYPADRCVDGVCGCNPAACPAPYYPNAGTCECECPRDACPLGQAPDPETCACGPCVDETQCDSVGCGSLNKAPGCLCLRDLAGELRCGVVAAPGRPLSTCGSDRECVERYGEGAFCTQAWCAGLQQCAVPCTEGNLEFYR